MARSFDLILSIHVEDTVLLQKGLKTSQFRYTPGSLLSYHRTRALEAVPCQRLKMSFLSHWHSLGTLFEFQEGKMITHGTVQGGEADRHPAQYCDHAKEGLLMKLRKKRDQTFYRIVPPSDFKFHSPNDAHVFVQSLVALGLSGRLEWLYGQLPFRFVVENAHPAVKTPEEHAEIVTLLESRRIQPKHARRGTYLLSGLLYCGKCGYSLQFQPKPNGRTLVKKCQKTDAFGNCCGNRGLELEPVEKAVMESLREHEAELLKMPVELHESDFPTEHLLHTKERELESLRDGVNRLKDLFVMGDVTKAEYKTRLERLKDLIVRKENEYEQLKESLDGCSPLTHAERLQLIDELKASWTTAINVKERNRLMKLIIERIEYTRNGDEVDIQVKFK